ncbi:MULTISPECIES: acyl-CoA dehydrogenase [unclassified Pseudomonas]|uniref:acyl-CoA dehydrogenase n=1 Tax=unclassified Pseudomonas TaxID=196821 RepID=UPI000C889ABD|nr:MULTISPECIES: acyl-CoA dehydrogenase [unclassified Pseudomonas]PMZ73227.1 acyl-CoA dehydrogenase [Pseudomonas sp. GW247-3R2A]PMY73357.1 acyl-CoA dehydrogenase [Pseudomonas sp. MPR-R3A]PMY98037.1 acyl-CoA dehydrogenase [Pseudomonas sp. FW305-124]PNA92625.1 acyl-CoA dehydrogenase [Pseudomonas sp. FW300-E2]PNB03177.1 acyl-CoA dehydrogenase [Pseudomonas sp. MPR-AND1B]
MTDLLLNEREMHFQLYELLDTQALLHRPRYAEHDRAVFDAILNTAQRLAADYYAPHHHKGDSQEPTFDGERVTMIGETKLAWDAFAEAGFLAAHHDYEDGGLQLPELLLRVCMAYFNAANIATVAYSFLSIGAANLVKNFAASELRSRFLPPMLDGRFSGTMALTEPGQGSALGDLRTSARLTADGTYRVFGQKMFISGGDHDLTENIVHMVLARIEGAPAGVKGISLFLVPKWLVNADGSLGERNDVVLAGLLHKMGYRNTTSTVLNFGENEGAQAYLVGQAGKGLAYMFQMMNEARIGVGLGAASLGYQSYAHSLAYARERPQGRLPGAKNPSNPQVRIIEHPDVRRMLLQQKVYAEGSLALCLYASSLVEDAHTADTEQERQDAGELLDLLTPMVKSWPSRYGLLASEIGVQVLGGAGYTRDYPLEQYYRDNRLNPIHEGTEGIQALDLLGRKLGPRGGAGYSLFLARVDSTIRQATATTDCAALAHAVSDAVETLEKVTWELQKQVVADADRGLANATAYLDLFGRVVVGWIWLHQALVASRAKSAGAHGDELDFYNGKLHAASYFMDWELAPLPSLAKLLTDGNSVCFDMQDRWF